ncbi:MAG TPA: 2Fe-2S iron-sulfur cluster-binding protein, partial [Gemmataceae bacterium]|nr:2Fe-2S iron-sulfur cluster-binding protein [Gemmataceae bacterium]
RRSYTIASSPTRSGYCELTVKREGRGLASGYLHDTVRAGDSLQVRAPAGRFTFTGAEADSIVLIAGGVGITPLMAKIRYLTDLSWPGDIYLIFSVKTERDIIFRDELDALGRRHANLHVTVTLTRDDGADWFGERGRINPALLARTIAGISARRVHICGPTEMTDPTRQMLRDLGVPDEAIRVESFASPSRAATANIVVPSGASLKHVDAGADNLNGEDATITFARSRKSASPAGLTVLETAEALRIAINYDCRAGICGQCKTRLLAGHVVMDAEDALDPVDRANDVILACQARCVDQVVVDA